VPMLSAMGTFSSTPGQEDDRISEQSLLPSHLARAQEAYNRVSEHLSSIKSSRIQRMTSQGSPQDSFIKEESPSSDLSERAAQLDEALKELQAGLGALRDSRAAHLALREEIRDEVQLSELAEAWEDVPSIVAASGICHAHVLREVPEAPEAPESPEAQEAALENDNLERGDAAVDEVPVPGTPKAMEKGPPSAPRTPIRPPMHPLRINQTPPSKAGSPTRITPISWTRPMSPKDNIREMRERPSPNLRRIPPFPETV